MIIQAAQSYSPNDNEKLEQYIQFVKRAFQVNSAFELLYHWRHIILKEGDLTNTIPSVIQNISIIDLSINILSEESYFEYIKHKRGEDLTIWKIKTKLNSRKQLGVFFSPRIEDSEGNILNGSNSDQLLKRYGYFKTAIYNIKTDNNQFPVFKNQSSLYSFPMTENYFFGPSNIELSTNLLDYCQEFNKSSIQIKIWLRECKLHSLIMHYIGINYEKLMLDCPIEHLKFVDVKEFISFFECKIITWNINIK